MTTMTTMRAGTLALVLAAGALAGCTVPGAQVASTNPSMVAAGPANTGPYSGAEWNAALDNAMTSDNGGE